MGACHSQPKYQDLHQTFVKMNKSNTGNATYKEFLKSQFPNKLQALYNSILSDYFRFGTDHKKILSFEDFLDISQCVYSNKRSGQQNVDCSNTQLNSGNQKLVSNLMKDHQDEDIIDLRNIVEKMVDSTINASKEDQISISKALGLDSRGMDIVFRHETYNSTIKQDYIQEHEICLLIDRLAALGVDLSGLSGPTLPSPTTTPTKLSQLLIKEYDSTHSGALSSLEFDSLMRALSTELKAHQVFLGTDLKVIGDYITGRTLGFGKTGIVKCAVKKDQLENSHYCLKIQKKAKKMPFFNAPGYVTQLPEHQALLACQSDYVVKFYEFFTHDTSWDVISQELCGGGSLMEYRLSTPITEPIARYFFTQILLGLEAIHSAEIAHLDLRLANILIDSNGDVKIADFGNSVSFASGKLIKAGTIAGTLSSMPPEMLTFKDDFQAEKVDMWQCGLILFKLLTGKPVFNPGERVVQQIINGEFEPLNFQFSAEARQLVASLLEQEPENRPSVTEALDSAWLQLPLHRPAIAKGIIMLDPAPGQGELCMKIEGILRQEHVEFVALKSAVNQLGFKCTTSKNVVFVIKCEIIVKNSDINEIELSQTAVQSQTGQVDLEDYILSQFALNQKVAKITFYQRQGVLWEFQKVFKRIRFLMMQSENCADVEIEEILIRQSTSYTDEHSGLTRNNHSFLIQERGVIGSDGKK